MKKKYFKPEMQVYEVRKQQLLQASTETYRIGGRTADDDDDMW